MVRISRFASNYHTTPKKKIKQKLYTEDEDKMLAFITAKPKKLNSWLKQLEDITYDEDDKVFMAEFDIIEKKYKTPEEYRKGEFKLYRKDNDNLSILFNLGKETIGWEIGIETDEDIFSLFGKSGKYPAQIETRFREGKLIDSGKVELGVQRDGYHEYILQGNKFDTKFHVRVIPVEDKDMWLAWTGMETKPVDSDSDEGVWDITKDKFAKLQIRNN